MACGGVIPSKKRVEDVVRGTNLGDLSPAWIDDIVGLVQSRLSSSGESTDASEPSTPSDGPSTPSSELSDPPDWIPRSKPFQATVEDDDCSTVNESTAASNDSTRPSSNTCRRRLKLSSSNTCSRPPTCLKNASLEKERSSAPPFAPSSPSSSAPSSPKLRPTVHFSERPPPRLNSRVVARQDTAKISSAPELSVVDFQWGRLLTGHGEPTTRLRQVLRGLASYINAKFEPANSVVITPAKLCSFYKKCQLDAEPYPFQIIFDCCSRKPMRTLELLFQDLRCEYHLVQGATRNRPYIPALTSDGFVNWMSAFIQANHDAEAKRLNIIMATFPVEAEGDILDGKPERLPKKLSRHLFPSQRHEGTRQCVDNALQIWYDILGLSTSNPPSCLAPFRALFYRSLSPKPRDRGPPAARENREMYIEVIEVPPVHASSSHHRSSSSYHGTQDWNDHARSSGKVLVEEASRHGRDESPRRHHRHHCHGREGSPRASKQRHAGRDRNRHAEPRDAVRGVMSGYASPLPATTSPSSREGSPKSSADRAHNYAFFQRRESGPTYGEILREAPAAKRPQRTVRPGA